ncbi:MAG TPA: response regulator transcription factor [Acidimicrobiales bacterium]
MEQVPRAAGEPSIDPGPLRIMVVDDAPHVRRMLGSMLEIDGFQVVAEAADSTEALARADECNPDVVIIDYRMPVTDGLETAQRIRSRRPDQVTVLYTAYIDAELEDRAAKAGIALVLGKEEGLDSLEREIGRLFPGR